MAEQKMVSLTIEGRAVSVPEGTTILEAAKTEAIERWQSLHSAARRS